MNYRVGSLITYEAFDGERRDVVVDEKSEDIKNGRPGFGGEMSDGDLVWGYDYQIVKVVRF